MKQTLFLKGAAALMLGAALLQPQTTFAQKKGSKKKAKTTMTTASKAKQPFKVEAESFADLQLLRYQIPGFNELPLQQKKLCYYLSQAALSGRDIIYDQRGKHNLLMRKTLETMYGTYTGPKKGPEWDEFVIYCGRFWFSNGNHHHYGNEKFVPRVGPHYFLELLTHCDQKQLPLEGKTLNQFWIEAMPYFFDENYEPREVDQRPDVDNIVNSSNNFYEGVTQEEVEAFYAKFNTKGDAPSWGLNSKLIKENGVIREKVWKSGSMYGAAIQQIINWLEKAVTVAENAQQKTALQLLIKFYQTGDLKIFDDYSIAWVKDVNSRVDVVNGFIEVYLDAIGKKGSFESIVSIKDMEETKRIEKIASYAQWFEDHSPLMPEHKKKEVKGITAKAITVVMESGDAAPSTPIGINLPNADWIRKEHGSKSVSLSNIIKSYNTASASSGMLEEFATNPEVLARLKKYGPLASDLHTDMHECIGHASGQINPGVETTDKTLKTYASTLEEARADLVGLYYIMDPKLVEIGVMPSLEVGKAEYDSYMMNGLMTQLTRLQPGHDIEEAHMRNRALNAYWAYEHGKKDSVVVFIKRNGKTYVQVNDYEKLRTLFGELLREIQRIKSEGDYTAGKNLVETYGVKVNETLHQEVLERYAKLNIKAYKGFIQPKLVPVLKGGVITDVKVEYPESFYKQMMDYGKNYSFLPINN
ncbi:MAG: hypothetical protein ABI378_08650 [Chitinophagaceae bacterium]